MTDMKASELYDVIIIGGGPAGLTAAIYLARARYRVLVMEKEQFGGQITITSEVVNYPGIPRTDGRALTEAMRKQAAGFGAEFLKATAEEILKSTNGTENHLWLVRTDRGEFCCFGLLAATGAHPRMIGFTGEEEFRGRGVAYCATCDGEFFTGKEIFVVGGGFAAAEESVFLTKYASHVTILVREPDFTCAKATADAAWQNDRITVLVNTEVEAVTGDTAVNGIRYVNNVTGERTEFRAPEGEIIGVFVFAGYEPATELFKNTLKLDAQRYIVANRNQETSADGIYAAGDVCVKNLRQVVTAVGDGATAATEMEKYAAKMQKKTGIVPKRKGGADRETWKQPYAREDDRKTHIDEKHGNAEKPEKEREGGSAEWENTADDLFDEDTLAQLADVFDRMEQDLILEIHPDDRPISRELEEYMNILAAMTERLTVRTVDDRKSEEGTRPYVKILREDGTYTGLAFHGVPGGHEFTPFILSLFNAAGPGQRIDCELEERIAAIHRPAHMKIMVSLTCEVCPDLVAAAQRIAAGNPYITAEVYDFAHFPQMSEEFHVLSVPCLIVNEDYVTFGKKTIKQLLDILETVG